MSLDDAAAWLRADLTRAVSERLVSDVPVGVFLSGGLDSTGLVYAAKEAGLEELNTFTVRFDERSYDESHFARRVAEHFKTTHHEELVHPEPAEVFGPLMEALDTPFADSSAVPLWYLCKSARERVTVVLGGDGGDELLAGYATHVAGQVARLYRRLPPSVTRLGERLAASLPVRHGKVSLDLKLKQFTRAAALSPAEAHFRFKEFLHEEQRLALLTPTLERLRDEGRSLLSPARHMSPFFDVSEGEEGAQTLLEQTLTCDQRLYLPDNILVKGDRVSMGCSLELRVPYLDVHLATTLNALPDSFKLRRLNVKWLLKRALLGRVPHEVLWRKKQGFNVPMAQWLMGPLKPLCDELLSEEVVRRAGLWNPEVVTQMRREHEGRVRDHSRPLWAMLCVMSYLARWE
jgi:asparagine synthase (glutamine-hydrolysing)